MVEELEEEPKLPLLDDDVGGCGCFDFRGMIIDWEEGLLLPDLRRGIEPSNEGRRCS